MKKQLSNWQLAKLVTRGLCRLSWNFVIGLQFKAKWLLQDLAALFKGFSSHRAYMQNMLDHNHRIYAQMKMHESGFWAAGSIHAWDEAELF